MLDMENGEFVAATSVKVTILLVGLLLPYLITLCHRVRVIMEGRDVLFTASYLGAGGG